MIKSMKKPFIWLCGIYTLAISSILRANFNYIDDMGRTLTGSKGWSFYSRFLTEFLSNFVHADSYLADVSPLPQLLAAVIMACAGAVILYLLADEGFSPFWGAVAMIPLGLSPYFLQCFSYKYDAPYMALSVLASVLPPLVYTKSKKGYLIYSLCATLSTIVVCTTYQAASGIFPMLCVAIAMKLWNNKETISNILIFAGLSVAGFLAGLLIFRLFIVVPVDFYASTDIFSIKEMVPGILGNIGTYFTVIIKDFRKIWLLLILIEVLLYITANCFMTKRSRLSAIFISMISVVLMAVLSFGAYIALSKPLFDPRGMYGFGAFIAFISVPVFCCKKKAVNYTKVVSLVLGWFFIVFAFNYGNALNEQGKYTHDRITQVVASLNTLDIMSDNSQKIIEISGTEGYAPSVENRPSNYRMLRNLVPIAFSEDRSWGYTLLIDHYGFTNLTQDASVSMKDMNLPVLVDTPLHTIQGEGSYILITLH